MWDKSFFSHDTAQNDDESAHMYVYVLLFKLKAIQKRETLPQCIAPFFNGCLVGNSLMLPPLQCQNYWRLPIRSKAKTKVRKVGFTSKIINLFSPSFEIKASKLF